MQLAAAMTLEQKIAQLHGAMETIDIYAINWYQPQGVQPRFPFGYVTEMFSVAA